LTTRCEKEDKPLVREDSGAEKRFGKGNRDKGFFSKVSKGFSDLKPSKHFIC